MPREIQRFGHPSRAISLVVLAATAAAWVCLCQAAVGADEGSPSSTHETPAPAARPNLIFILADDK